MGHVETCLLMSGMYLSSHYGSAPVSFTLPSPGFTMRLTSQFCHLGSFVHPTPGFSCWDCRRGYGGPPRPFGYVYAPPPISISYFHIETCSLSLQRKSTDMCDVVTNPIIWNFSPPIWVHCIHPRGGMGLNCREPCFRKA